MIFTLPRLSRAIYMSHTRNLKPENCYATAQAIVTVVKLQEFSEQGRE
jgi:hypothetical protein